MTLFVIAAVTLFSIVSPSSTLFSQDATPSRLQYELLKSENFVKPINSWLFPAIPEQTTNSVIAIAKDQIMWLSDSNVETFTLPTASLRTIFSKGGNYFGVLTLAKEPEDTNRDKMFQVEIYSANKEKLYTLERKQYYDDSIPSVTISNLDGSVIIAQNTTGKIWFYDKNGILINDTVLFPDVTYDLERILHVDLSEDGSRLAVVAGRRGSSPSGSEALKPSAEAHLFLFTPKGDELWRMTLPEFNTLMVAISGNGQYIAANSYTIGMRGNIKKRTTICDGNGNEIKQLELLFKYARFSPDSKFLLLAENTVAKVLELSTGKVSWSLNISRRQGMITAGSISNEGEVAALLVAKNEFKDGAFIFTNPGLKIFGRSGELYQDLEITGHVFRKPALQLSPNSEEIFVGFEKSYQIYHIKNDF